MVASLYLYSMSKNILYPPEIVKVRAERDSMICRIPRWFVDRHKLTSKSYLVFRDKLDGKIELVPWEDHIDGQRIARARKG